MQWSDTLEAPRSLLTGPDIAVSVIEDPGFIALYGDISQSSAITAVLMDQGIPVPVHHIAKVAFFSDGFTLERKRAGLWIFCSRSHAAELETALKAAPSSTDVVICNRTGHFSAFRIAGIAAPEILTKVCSLQLFSKHHDHAVSFTHLDLEIVLIPERDGDTLCWRLLVPRSGAAAFAEKLVSASLLQPRIEM